MKQGPLIKKTGIKSFHISLRMAVENKAFNMEKCFMNIATISNGEVNSQLQEINHLVWGRKSEEGKTNMHLNWIYNMYLGDF